MISDMTTNELWVFSGMSNTIGKDILFKRSEIGQCSMLLLVDGI